MAVPNGIKVDGITYSNIHIVSLKRDGEILDGENSGRAQSGQMIRDIIGTYFNYSVAVDCDRATLAEYDSLYNVLTQPVDYHVIEMPFGQTTLNFKAYVSSVSDELLSVVNEQARWGSMSFKFVALAPQIR